MENSLNDPLVRGTVRLAHIFAEIRGEFASKRGYPPIRRYLPVNEPWTGKYFNAFLKAYLFLKGTPDIDVPMFVRAQFAIQKNRDIYPTDLASEWAIQRYFTMKKHEKKYADGRAKQIDYSLLKKKDKEYIALYCTNNNIQDPWKVMDKFRGVDVPIPIFLWLNKRITIFYIIEVFPEDTMAWAQYLHNLNLISDEKFRAVYVIHHKNRATELDD